MPERGPLGLRRPLGVGPLSGDDAIVAVRMEGEAPEVDEPIRDTDDVPRIVSVIVDAVAHETREFLEFTQASTGGEGTKKWLVSQAPVSVGEEFDHWMLILYYPDSSISKRDIRSIRNEIQRRTERAISINIMRV